ncbi:hypothetical protein [Burkholderia ubonensis]|uniref:hypothetical protein n=1 Tax=Burkholderia ubonensis TaxID=101571 RepID=UPI000AC2410C|nr:hypothetical protein [Burkholderia ubonensis]
MKRIRQLRPIAVLSAARIGNPIPRARWILQRTADRLQPPGMAALAVLIAAAVYQFAIQGPRAAELASDRAGLAQTLAKPATQANMRAQSPADRLKAMLHGDPAAQKLAVFDTLRQYGVDARESTYRKDDEVKGKLERWSMNIAMTGRYADLVQALKVFAAQPLLRIDVLTLERPRIEDDTLNVDLRVSLLGAES